MIEHDPVRLEGRVDIPQAWHLGICQLCSWVHQLLSEKCKHIIIASHSMGTTLFRGCWEMDTRWDLAHSWSRKSHKSLTSKKVKQIGQTRNKGAMCCMIWFDPCPHRKAIPRSSISFSSFCTMSYRYDTLWNNMKHGFTIDLFDIDLVRAC